MRNFSLKWCASFCRLFLLFIIFSSGWLPECPAQASGSAGDAASMVISETKFDFGEVDEGSVVSHDFIVKNNGGVDLRIVKVSPD